ncbi:discoidin domain-containing protein [Paenibacillus mendelii]|uniref:Discoidin domain-containing protein n=1 Tax=Paenibacillus mendelii TaxID=206163 RepID=A0ABV6J9B0_9BACL|nr:discoidin domain-containing protein [Paenibacillus mendelii]MCQ6559927.1 discoidin domain-containing protein [Paenibacillus mendelii]
MNWRSKAFNVRLLIVSMLLTLIPAGLVQADAGGEAINLALGKEVTSSSSYEMANEGWARVNLVDGSKTGPRPPGSVENGFSTFPLNPEPTPAWVMIDLGAVYKVDQLVLWPRNDNGTINMGGGFPVDFKIMISTDKSNWATVVEKTDYPIPVDAAAQIFDIDTADARYVRLEATKLQAAKEVVMQFREFEVFSASLGLSDEEIVDNDWASLVLEGNTENIVSSLPLRKVGMLGSTISWSSSDTEVIDSNGKVTRPPAGQETAAVTLTATITQGEASMTKEFAVTVKPHKLREAEEEELLIGIFWPPTWEYTNLEQYQWMKDAHIDVVQNVLGSGLDTETRNMTMLDYAEQVGLKVNVADPRIRGTDAQIKEVVDTYKDYWATGGYYIRDEPGIGELDREAHIYQEVLKNDSTKNPYVNLLPNIYGDLYESDYVRAWVKAVGNNEAGVPNLKYLSYDNYPFLKNSFDNGYYDMADIIRQVGLENNIKTASYLQSIGFGSLGSTEEQMHHRRPSAQDLSFSAYSYLAYGFKYLTWFTYWTPTERGEAFTNAIITPDGQKTDLYEPFQRLNAEVKQLGKTLIHTDALQVYHSGAVMPTTKTQRVPDDFLLRPVNANDELIISYMVHKDTGKSYVMVVNKSLTESLSSTLQADPRVTNVQEVSKVTGEEEATTYDPASGNMTIDLLPGEGRLFVLEGSFPGHQDPRKPELLPQPPTSQHPATNLALGKTVDASSDVGNWGWLKSNAVDGKRTGEGDSMGWSSVPINPHPATPAWIQVDLGREYPVETVTLWPRNDSGTNIGVGFPESLEVKVSTDGESWTPVLALTDIAQPTTGKPLELKLETPVSARYVKVETNKMRPDPNKAYAFQIAELEVYQHDSGSRLDVQVDSTDMIIGQHTTLRAGMWQDNLTLLPLEDATFTSSDKKIVTVDENGVLTALSEGSVTIKVKAEGKEGRTEQKEIVFTVRKLPDPWGLTTFGDVQATVIPDSEQLVLSSSGAGVGELDDSYAFIHQAVDGDYNELSAEFTSFAIPSGAEGLEGRTGLMFRAGTGAGASLVYLSISPEGRMELRTRDAEGNIETAVRGSYTDLPVSLKLVQKGDRFTGYYSKGSAWYPIYLSEYASSVQLTSSSGWQGGLASFSNVDNRQNQTTVRQFINRTEKLLFDFEGTTQGWTAKTNLVTPTVVESFLNGPTKPKLGKYALSARSAPIDATTWRTFEVAPESPIDLSVADQFFYHINSYGGVPNATYETKVTFYSGTESITSTAPMSADMWNRISVSVADWEHNSQVTRIEISFRAVGNNMTWSPEIQLDYIGYTSTKAATKQVASLRTEQKYAVLKPNQPVAMKVYAVYEDGKEKEISGDAGTVYQSSNVNVVGVTGQSLRTGSVEGMSVVTVSYGGKQTKFLTVVDNSDLKSVIPSAYNVQLMPKASATLQLQAVFMDGTRQNVTAYAGWTSNVPKLATVQGSTITAVKTGNVIITVKFAGKVNYIMVNIR